MQLQWWNRLSCNFQFKFLWEPCFVHWYCWLFSVLNSCKMLVDFLVYRLEKYLGKLYCTKAHFKCFVESAWIFHSPHAPSDLLQLELVPEIRIFSEWKGIICLPTDCLCLYFLVTANCSDIVPTPPLTFKKWGYKQGQVTDSAVVGLTSANMFQHLYTASVCGGFNSW